MRRHDQGEVIYFGASYHADYATVLSDPADLSAVTNLLAADESWDLIDLRRLRSTDPALPALEAAFRSSAAGWQVTRRAEDVCPVVMVDGPDWDEYLGGLDKKDRHEIRRKLRRAAVVGNLSIEIAAPTPVVIDTFIELHNARWGEDGLFPTTEGGERSRRFVHRLAELELAEADGGVLHVGLVRCGERLIFAMLAFDDGKTCFLYNAGMDPRAAEVSPGVTGTALYMRDRMAAGRRRFDFLRGNESYKYEWGARDEPVELIRATRRGAA
jgi:CelD/BcsL family acetyltransferase involved in cellulose biosynthesis